MRIRKYFKEGYCEKNELVKNIRGKTKIDNKQTKRRK